MSVIACSLVAATLLLMAGCNRDTPASTLPSSGTLRIGLGASAAQSAGAEAGMAQIVNILASETLLSFDRDGRAIPVVAKGWTYSPDGLTLRLQLREAHFHDGTPVTAAAVKAGIERRLARVMGPGFEDIDEIRAESEREIVFSLKRPSALLLEALDIPIQKADAPPLQSGPFKPESAGDEAALVANDAYYGGRPALDRIVLRPYESIRAAWADLLRGNVDMLYEVGPDALASLEPSTRVKMFSYRRHYQYALIFNMRRPRLQDPGLRRRLSAAVDRTALIQDALAGRATPSQGPVWPDHWAIESARAAIPFSPDRVASSAEPLRFDCLLGDPSHERIAIALQRQLQSVGVELELHIEPTAEAVRRMEAKEFDLVFLEIISAPNLLRPFTFWHSKGPYNYGGFSSPAVDTALDAIRHALDDDAYKAGVAAFQHAIEDDPPAIFLAWGERARAVSTAFEVPSGPDRDPLGTLRLWRPVAARPLRVTTTN